MTLQHVGDRWPSSYADLLEQESQRTPEERVAHAQHQERAMREKIDSEVKSAALAFARRHSHLGERFEQRTFATYACPPGDANARAIAESIAEEPTRGAWFFGPFGNGKTHLGAAIVNASVERFIPSTFTPVLPLLDLLKRSYDRSDRVREGEFDVIQALAKVPVLVLDDLDKAEFTKWASQRIYALINGRYENNLPLIVTSNSPVSDLGIAWSKAGLDAHIAGAIIDRMREMCGTFVRVEGRSQRGAR